MTAGGSTTREEHRKRERQNAEMQVEGTGNIRFTRRDACLQCTRSDFCSIPLRFCASSSFHALPTTMNILCPRTSGVRSAPLRQMKFERSMRIHQIGSCCVETEASQFTKWNRETIFVDIYHGRRETFLMMPCAQACDWKCKAVKLYIVSWCMVENRNNSRYSCPTPQAH